MPIRVTTPGRVVDLSVTVTDSAGHTSEATESVTVTERATEAPATK